MTTSPYAATITEGFGYVKYNNAEIRAKVPAAFAEFKRFAKIS